MSWLKKQKIETVLPRVLMVCGFISFLVYLFISSDDGKFTRSHSSYVALGILIGFYSSAIISWLAIWVWVKWIRSSRR